jgi:hypothetical protein
LPGIALASGLFRALFGYRIAQRRWNRINSHLFEIGFREADPSEVKQTLGLPVQLLAPRTLDLKRGGGIDHLTIGMIEGREVRSFNVRIRGGGWLDIPALAVRVATSFPPTMIRRRIRGLAVPMRSMKGIRYEHERFNRSVAVYSSDPYFASALADARMMEWLRTRLGKTQIELSDRWVVMWCVPWRGHVADPRRLVNTLLSFEDRIPRAVPSLFPERQGEFAWQHVERSD